MARWEPNAAERLSQAALELFAERGYEETSVIDIAQRAGLGKTTFFRHFQDKREVLFHGAEADDWLIDAIAEAPEGCTPLEAVARALDAAGAMIFALSRRPFIVQRQAVIAAHPELQEREALKNLRLTASMVEALERRGIAEVTARVAAELGALASSIALERWSRSEAADEFGVVARRTLEEVKSSAGRC
jgi:AcrR family transcriptional regulator